MNAVLCNNGSQGIGSATKFIGMLKQQGFTMRDSSIKCGWASYTLLDVCVCVCVYIWSQTIYSTQSI